MSHCSRSWARASSLRPLFTSPATTTPRPLLPFLYQTRSIRTGQHDDPEDIPFDIHVDSSPDPPPSSENDADPFAYLYKPSEQQHAAQQAAEQHMPPETSYVSPSHRHRRRIEHLENTTLTQREASIFKHILEEVLPGGTSISADSPPRVQAPPSDALKSLFESTIGPVQSGPAEISFGPGAGATDPASITAAMARASTMESYPISMRAAAARAAGISQPTLSPKEEQQEKARLKELERLVEELRACETDHELLQWMETNVFGMITSLDRQQQQQQQKQKKKAQEEKESAPAGTEYAAANYADLLVEGMKALRKTFGDVAGVVYIFDRIKRLGAESYVMGCSVGVYNVVLGAVWDGYADWSRVQQLLDEMRVNGVEGDNGTLSILRKIRREVENMMQGKRGIGAEVLYRSAGPSLLESLEQYTYNLNSQRL